MTFNHGSAWNKKEGCLLGKYITSNCFTGGKDRGCGFPKRHSGLFFKTIHITYDLIKIICIDFIDTKLILQTLLLFAFLVSISDLWIDTNKAIDQNLLDNILSVNSVSNAMQGKVRNSPKNRAKMINVITDSYGVASTIKHSSDLIEGILYQAANIEILPEVSSFSNSSRTFNERHKTQIIRCSNSKGKEKNYFIYSFRSLIDLGFIFDINSVNLALAHETLKRCYKFKLTKFSFHTVSIVIKQLYLNVKTVNWFLVVAITELPKLVNISFANHHI